MSRCIHISINENPGAAPRRAATSLPGRAGTDPGMSNVMPLPEDPASSNVMPLPEDPGGSNVMPLPEDPGDTGSLYGVANTGGDCGMLVSAHACCCAAAACQCTAPGKTTPHPFIGPQDYSGFVIVRMAPGIESRTAETLWDLAKDQTPKLAGLKAALRIPDEAGHFVSRPLVELSYSGARGDELDSIHGLERSAATSPFPPLHSLTAYWRLDLRKHPGLVEEVVKRLNRLAEVDLAYRELTASDPKIAAMDGKDFAEDQGYLADAPMGISATWAWHSLGATPLSTSITLCDLEQGWNLHHNALVSLKQLVLGDNRDTGDQTGSGNHGTAVLGQLVAEGTGMPGVRGAAAVLNPFVLLASHYKAKGEFANTNGQVAEAIYRALAASTPLGAGDILLLEVQRGLLPTEVDEADFDAIRLAAGLGVIVVEAAGNGGFDLDAYSDLKTGRSLRRGDPRFRDSGAILVGAARAGLPHDRAPFSNYGSRLDCFGWGEAVTTCGYGDLARTTGENDSYTNSFSGTSSASPIIAGAAALLQSLHETHTGMRLEPRAMREILADPTTGTRQGPNVSGHIGVMPDLKAVVRDRLQLVPDVYLRRSIGDDGVPPTPEDEISSSPDLLISSQTLKIASLFGAGSPGENFAAPGEPVFPGDIYLRLRNRGLSEGKVHVQLFASPVATLITPERWLPVSPPGLNFGPIPQGDTLFMAGPVPWVSVSPSPQPWSLLAILSEPKESGPPGLPSFDRTGGMPPGPPYFDWAEYRAFLRGPGVAWRNTHHDTTASPTLHFFIAGTPDRARHFDFEVIQRLPVGTKVTLQVPGALAAKLHQRQPWLGDRNPLPKRPRIAIRGVELAAGAWIEATFTVNAGGPGGPPQLTSGHSLAIRQLWRGEEVGRITWFFGPPA
jgi:serine protease